MIKKIIFFILALLTFIIFGVFFSEKAGLEAWCWSFFIYLIGLQWVYCFLFSKTMYAYYIAEPLEHNNLKHKYWRIFYFSIGSILCVGSSVF